MQQVFSLRDYFTAPDYPASIEVWLTTTPIVDQISANLADYSEATFNGYARVAGNREALFSEPKISGSEISVASKLLCWTFTGGPPQGISAGLVVAVWPDGSRSIVSVVPHKVTFTINNPGASFSFVLTNSSLAA